jgi:hypothetical protein
VCQLFEDIEIEVKKFLQTGIKIWHIQSNCL